MSKYLYSVFFLCIYSILHPVYLYNSNGMGTVLFSACDIHKQCWSPEEIAILTTRMILEDLLPDTRILKIDCDEYVNDIVDYFRLLIESTKKMSAGSRKKHITMLALTDLLGGYLQHAVLPISREAYYAGIIDYLSMEKLIQLFEELKWFLRTNGQGWSLPIRNDEDFDVQPIDFRTESAKCNKSCCRNLIYYRHEPLKKRSADSPGCQSFFFPVPFLDSKVRPNAIAVPFKKFALRNIGSKKAAYLVMKYFISVERCFQDVHPDQTTMEKFHNNLFTWIEKQVIPKLKDDKFYSAFGGILRVEETLRSLGAKENEDNARAEEEEGEEEVGAIPGGESSSRSSMVLMAMLIIIFVWFIIGTLFICYRMRANNLKGGKKRKGQKSDGTSYSPTSPSSRWSATSKSRSTATCKCCSSEKTSCKCSSATTGVSSTHSSETDEKSRGVTICYPVTKQRSQYSSGSPCPAIIDTKHSMKVLPSIPEMSENSSLKKAGSKGKKISFEDRPEPPPVSNTNSGRSRMKVCVPMKDVETVPCPHYSDKATSISSSKSKSDKQMGTQMSESGVDDVCSLKEDSTDDTAVTANSPHIYACHSSLTGNYTSDQRYPLDKPCIFGYDFQTSSSSDASEDDTDGKTSTTK